MKDFGLRNCFLSRGYTYVFLFELSFGCCCFIYHKGIYITKVNYSEDFQTILDGFLLCRYKRVI